MANVNFAKEYNKLLRKSNEFAIEYASYLKFINIKSLVYLLNKYDVLSVSDKIHFNEFFDMFVIEKDGETSRYIPFIMESKCKIKLKRKQLLKYLHPDKIQMLYGNIQHDMPTYFNTLLTEINGNDNLTTFDILEKIFTSNPVIFDIVTKRLLDNKLVSNNEIKSVKSNAKVHIANTTYYAQHSQSPPRKYDVHSMFPVEIQTFVNMYNMLKEEEPIQRFKSDIFLILNSVFTVIRPIVRKISESKLIINSKGVANIMQIFKLAKLDRYVDILLSLRTYLPNCYVKMIELFKIRTDLGYIADPIFIRIDYFVEELVKDFVFGVNKYTLDQIRLLRDTFEKRLNSCDKTEAEQINIILVEMMGEINRMENESNNCGDIGSIDGIEAFSDKKIEAIKVIVSS